MTFATYAPSPADRAPEAVPVGRRPLGQVTKGGQLPVQRVRPDRLPGLRAPTDGQWQRSSETGWVGAVGAKYCLNHLSCLILEVDGISEKIGVNACHARSS